MQVQAHRKIPILRRSTLRSLIVLALLAAAPAVQATGEREVPEGEAAVDAALLAQRIRATAPDLGRAVQLRDVRLVWGLAQIDVAEGLLVPAVTPSGRILEAVLVGRARFRCAAPDDIEEGQLHLFTGRRAIDTRIEEAVLTLTDPAQWDQLLEHPRIDRVDRERRRRVEALHAVWRESTERRTGGVETALFRHLLGDPPFARYVAVWAHSPELGEFLYQIDPEQEEPTSLGSFVPLQLDPWRRAELRYGIRTLQRKGRFLGVRLEDMGAWDVWLSDGQRDAADPFTAEHYDLDLRVRRRTMALEGSARVTVRAHVSDRRTLTLRLYRDLVVEEVTDASGRVLDSFRSGNELVVPLAEPSRAGEAIVLTIRYHGQALHWAGNKIFDLYDTALWYPKCGRTSLATYDVRLEWPKKFDLIGSGRPVEGGTVKRYRWERRTIDQATSDFSFVVGKFIYERGDVDGVDVTMAFAWTPYTFRTGPKTQAAFQSVAESLRRQQVLMGDYPLDYLNVAVIPRSFSQSFRGYVVLSTSVLRSAGAQRGADMDTTRDLTIAHEIAHQWWGNGVGWSSYRDQWLSEALANYVALVELGQRRDEGPEFLAAVSAGWRDSLSRPTEEGRIIESIGPVVLGERLNSSAGGNAYQPIVYRKGAVVLAMLSQAIGPERFLEILAGMARDLDGDVLTTEGFLSAVESRADLDLEGFANRFVYGTGIPQVFYDFDSQVDEAGIWHVRGRAHVVERPVYRFAIEPEGGDWRVTRTRLSDVGVEDASLIVPFRVWAVDGEGRPESRRGQVQIAGGRDVFEIAVQSARPTSFRLDPAGETLARFYHADSHPKRVARLRGQHLLSEGRVAEAEQALREVLAVEATADRKPGRTSRPAADDAQARLALARIALGRGNLEAAETELRAVDATYRGKREPFRVERDVLWTRIELARGRTEPALKRLRKLMRLADTRRPRRGLRELLARMQLRSERDAMTEAHALRAIAARRAGRWDELAESLAAARERGVDVRDFASTVEALDPANAAGSRGGG